MVLIFGANVIQIKVRVAGPILSSPTTVISFLFSLRCQRRPCLAPVKVVTKYSHQTLRQGASPPEFTALSLDSSLSSAVCPSPALPGCQRREGLPSSCPSTRSPELQFEISTVYSNELSSDLLRALQALSAITSDKAFTVHSRRRKRQNDVIMYCTSNSMYR